MMHKRNFEAILVLNIILGTSETEKKTTKTYEYEQLEIKKDLNF